MMKKNRFWNKLSSFMAFVLMIGVLQMPLPAVYSGEETVYEKIEIPEDAIYLSTAEDLVTLAENCRLDSWSAGKTVVLRRNIDVSKVEFSGIPTFGGTFLGQGYKITGFTTDKKGSVLGFFRYLQETALVYDLHLEAQMMPQGSADEIGALAGENYGTIRNCSFSGTVSGREMIGGLVGRNAASGRIEGCKSAGIIYGNHFVGGIAGENRGIIKNCENHAELNTQVRQNDVSLEDITMDSLMNTEYANTATDIGGIAGISSGIIEKCINYGNVGYANIGYNLGGIAGTQNGYIVACTNYGAIRGRKEIGGIVGQMEPCIGMDFEEDSVQTLNGQLQELQQLLNRLEQELDDDSYKINNHIYHLRQYIEDAQKGLEDLRVALHLEEEQPPEDFQMPDWNGAMEALSDVSQALIHMLEESQELLETVDKTASHLQEGMDEISQQIDKIEEVINESEDALGLEIEDISDKDTVEDTWGKVADSCNYGSVYGEFNAGGIAGIQGKEYDLDEGEDVEISGDISLNVNYKMRAVIRNCRNEADIVISKRTGGGIVGKAYVGCVLECISMGNVYGEKADYVGGIVGDSDTIIRNCNAKAQIYGKDYVGGIVGEGNTVTDCYGFFHIVSLGEYSGGILGMAEELPGPASDKNQIANNRYYNIYDKIGGIDGINYAHAAVPLSLEEFLAIENLDKGFLEVQIYFQMAEGENLTVSLPIGTILGEADIPEVPDLQGTTGVWDGLEEDKMLPVMFSVSYAPVYDKLPTVIEADLKKQNGLSVLLADGVFTHDTEFVAEDICNRNSLVGEKQALVHYTVVLAGGENVRLHYLLPEKIKDLKTELYVLNEEGEWEIRSVEQEGSYIVFDFNLGDEAFAIVEADSPGIGFFVGMGLIAIALLGIIIVIRILFKK